MTKAEIEQFLKEELDLNEVEPGLWVGRTGIPDLTTMQPFLVMVRLIDDRAVAVGINLGLRVDGNHEAVYEYLLEVNGKIALGEFLVDDEDRISIGAEMPCGTADDNYFSREELALMIRFLLDGVRDHYNRILQLIHGGEHKKPTGILKWLKSARERQ